MRAEGALLWRGCLSLPTVSALKAHIEKELAVALALAAKDPCEEAANFGNVLSRHCRYDLKLRLEETSPVQAALCELFGGEAAGEGGGRGGSLGGTLRGALVALLGADAELYELACMLSEPGARRQPVHPDTPCATQPTATTITAEPERREGGEAAAEEGLPVVVTGFIALQDITAAMGPTLVWRGTHTPKAHAAWEEEKVGLLERCRPHVALLEQGDMLLIDSRALHCGGENDGVHGARRALFYFSFKRRGSATGKSGPGTLRAELDGRYSIGSLAVGLGAVAGGHVEVEVVADERAIPCS